MGEWMSSIAFPDAMKKEKPLDAAGNRTTNPRLSSPLPVSIKITYSLGIRIIFGFTFLNET